MTTVLPSLQQWTHRPAANLPQTTLGALFTVSGGPCFITVLGRVTTVLGASASVLRFVADPTLGADSDLSLAAGTSFSGLAVGRWVGFTFPSGAILISAGGSADEPAMTASAPVTRALGTICAPGSISLNATGNQTGQMEWWCGWIPMVPGARVVAV